MRRAEKHFKNEEKELSFWNEFATSMFHAHETGYNLDFSQEIFEDFFEFCNMGNATISWDELYGGIVLSVKGMKFRGYESLFCYCVGYVTEWYRISKEG